MFLSRLVLKRKWIVMLGLLLMVMLLSGCMPINTQTTTTEGLKSGNFWEKYVVYYFSYLLDHFATWFNGQYGLAILVMVVIVRTLILPLTIKQYRSSKAMQALQPELANIKKKHKDNPQKQQEETMKLFQQHKVDPYGWMFAACYSDAYFYRALQLDLL